MTGRVKDLFMDECDKAMEYYIATHPGATEEDAWYALHGQDDQQLMEEEEQNVH